MEDSSIPTFAEAPFQRKGSAHPRTLTDEDKDRLKKQDNKIVSDFKQQKLEREAQRNWDLFYKRNSTNFFKDRHWTAREFEELANSQKDTPLVLLEAGCGVGNFLFPLLQENPSLFIHACDFSPRAVQFVKVVKPGGCVLFRDYGLYDHAMFRFAPGHKLADSFYVRQDGTRAYYFSTGRPQTADSQDPLVGRQQPILTDCNKCIATSEHTSGEVVKPGGCVLFRDYGLYDHAMFRFAPGHKLADSFYVRQDGTRAYYFSTDELARLFTSAGFCVVVKPGGCVLFRDYGLYDHAMFRFAPGHKLADSFYVRQDGTRAYYFSTVLFCCMPKDLEQDSVREIIELAFVLFCCMSKDLEQDSVREIIELAFDELARLFTSAGFCVNLRQDARDAPFTAIICWGIFFTMHAIRETFPPPNSTPPGGKSPPTPTCAVPQKTDHEMALLIPGAKSSVSMGNRQLMWSHMEIVCQDVKRASLEGS
uniref:Methyltransferase-like protein n=1 Tax=Branchiostoma floridae TaxID=7739 RepID=C3YC03_BRAFL|eukprot:XP_002606168.1 hypothetical protein BRAFLDRAFT_92035 [Branchiostoma floridae]